jgi:hypothetical protein
MRSKATAGQSCSRGVHAAARDTGRLEALLACCADLSGSPLPAV